MVAVLALGGCHKLLPFPSLPSLSDGASPDRPAADGLAGDRRPDAASLEVPLPLDGPQTSGWPLIFGGNSFPIPSDVTIDAAGPAFVTGRLYGVSHLGGQDQIASGSPDPFLIRVDGEAISWTKVWPSSGAGLTAVAAAGSVIVTGHFSGTLDLGDSCGTLKSPALAGFVAWLDVGGKCSAVLKLSGGADALPLAVMLVGSSEIYVTGSFKNGLTVGTCAPLQSKGPESIFLAKLMYGGPAAGLTCTWARAFDHLQTVRAVGTGLAYAGPNYYLSTTFSGTVDFGGLTLSSVGDLDGALVAFKAEDGSPQALAQVGGASKDVVGRLTTDAAGTVYMTGSFTGPANFKNGCSVLSATGQHAFLAAYTFDGGGLSCSWAKSLGGAQSQSSGLGLASTPAASGLWLVGTFLGQFTEAGVAAGAAPAGTSNGFALHLAAGSVDWGAAFPPGFGQTFGVKSDVTGAVVVGIVDGSTLLSEVFDPTLTVATESGGLYITRCPGTSACKSLDLPRGATDEGLAIAPGATAGVVVAGRFQTRLDPLSANASSGPEDIFVATVGPQGKALARGFGGTGSDRANAIVVDAAGDQYIAGSFDKAWASPSLTPVGTGRDVFVIKLSGGTSAWVKAFGGAGDDEARALALDGQGNVCVAGSFPSKIVFGSNILTATGRSAFVACLSVTDGAPVWSTGLTSGSGGADALALAPDGAGGVFVGGSYAGGALQPVGTLPVALRPIPVGGTDGFIINFSSGGALGWNGGVTGPADDAVQALAAGAGVLYAGGRFRGAASADCSGNKKALTAISGQDGFLARFDLSSAGASCQVVWAQPVSSSGDDQVTGLGLRPGGDLFVTGSVGGPPTFGGTYHGDQDILVARFGPAGGYVSSWIYGGVGRDVGQGIAVGAGGEVYVTGGFQRTVDFGTGQAAASRGGTDAFVMRLP
jgi:hypothetical protein